MIVPGRVSVVMPYWERGAALRMGLASLHQHYADKLDLEVVVADDGSPTDPAEAALMGDPFARAQVARMNVKLWREPRREHPLNPCVPINRGVAASSGEFVALTNPETTHRAPILGAMRETIERTDRLTYVLAGVFCPQTPAWHCHSEFARAGYHFCTMMHRDLWDKAGGFDPDYRDGYCFDDPDFVQRLLRAGARFVFRDDLVVDHHQSGDAKHWRPRADWDRNRALYDSKWPNPRSHDGQPLTEEVLQNWR